MARPDVARIPDSSSPPPLASSTTSSRHRPARWTPLFSSVRVRFSKYVPAATATVMPPSPAASRPTWIDVNGAPAVPSPSSSAPAATWIVVPSISKFPHGPTPHASGMQPSGYSSRNSSVRSGSRTKPGSQSEVSVVSSSVALSSSARSHARKKRPSQVRVTTEKTRTDLQRIVPLPQATSPHRKLSRSDHRSPPTRDTAGSALPAPPGTGSGCPSSRSRPADRSSSRRRCTGCCRRPRCR